MKRLLYNFLLKAGEIVIWPTQFFSPKMKLFIQGRKTVFETLQNSLQKDEPTLWFHCASLGEYEQGLPIMEAMKKDYPGHQLVLSFFSPSGYEVRKNAAIADVVCYLPLDTPSNVKKFLNHVRPSMAFFVKYEFWPNYLFGLRQRSIPTYLISGTFRENQAFFKPTGGLLREALNCFTHFFVQNKHAAELLERIGITNVTVSGDTRFDRVSHQIEMDNTLDFMDHFKGNSLCVVCGSTWTEDEEVLLPFINDPAAASVKFIVAPHKIDASRIKNFQERITGSSVLYSEKDKRLLSQNQVLIIDTIGLLSKIYSYADIAYVGGAMGKTGLHNILEPATFGVPIVIGYNFENFPEAQKLEDLAGLYSVKNSAECYEILQKLINDRQFREKTGMISGHFVNSNTGATRKIMAVLKELE